VDMDSWLIDVINATAPSAASARSILNKKLDGASEALAVL